MVLLGAVAVGLVLGGRLSRLADLELRSWPLLAAAVCLQLGGGLLGGVAYPLCLVASAVLALTFLGRNRRLRGTGLLAAGLLVNALVVALNGAMPVSVPAAARAGVPPAALLADPRHELATPSTRLHLLGDIIPLPLPVTPEVVSPGDLLVAAGLGELLVMAMTGAATPRPVVRAARPHLPPL